MKISSIPNLYRNVNRWAEILAVLSKYGLAGWLSRLNIDYFQKWFKDPSGEILATHSHEARIRMALSELGPTFIKFGQLLATRPDLVGLELAGELQKLQNDAPADPFEKIRAIVESELGQPVEDLFAEFDEEPIASASIGQVHRAKLRTGEEIVVKVQHVGIQEAIEKDLDVLAGLAQLAEMIPEFVSYRPVATAAEFQRTLRRELDFGREERNLQQFAHRFAEDSKIHIPRPIDDFCTPRVLAMERLDGIKLSELSGATETFDLEAIARHGAEVYMEMIFRDGVYHADPHPGNIVILPGGTIGLLDFGMTGRIEERLREQIEEMLVAIVNQDASHLTAVLTRLAETPPDLNERAFRTDVSEFVAEFASVPIDRLDLGKLLTEMTQLMFHYRMLLPAQIAMLIKTLVTLEGTGKMLNPHFSLLELIKPFKRRALMRRLSPARRLRKMQRIYMELEQLAEVLPRRVIEMLEQIRLGKFDVHLDHRGLGPSVNRLVLGMLASALFLGSSWMLSSQVPPLLFHEKTFMGIQNLSVLGLSGCIVSLLLGLRLLRAIGKSGHLDQRD